MPRNCALQRHRRTVAACPMLLALALIARHSVDDALAKPRGAPQRLSIHGAALHSNRSEHCKWQVGKLSS